MPSVSVDTETNDTLEKAYVVQCEVQYRRKLFYSLLSVFDLSLE